MFKLETKISGWFANENEVLDFLEIKEKTIYEIMIEKTTEYDEFLLRLNFAKIIDYYQQNNEEKKDYIIFEIGYKNGRNTLQIYPNKNEYDMEMQDVTITDYELMYHTTWDLYNIANDSINKYMEQFNEEN